MSDKRNRHLKWSENLPTNRAALLGAAVLTSLVVGGPKVRADAPEYYVVTVYFGGTNCTEHMWSLDYRWDQPPTLLGAHNGLFAMWQFFGQEDGLAALHHYHREEVQTLDSGVRLHHKTHFVNGVGSEGGPGPVELAIRIADIADPARPGAVRGWNWVIEQAHLYLEPVLAQAAADPNIDGVILNTVGFSRGGVSALWFANQKAHDARISKINILAFDPVPGWYPADTRVPSPYFYFGSPVYQKVNQYVGMYARDENSGQFWALMPLGIQKSLTVAFPGAHETIAGSRAVLGHSFMGVCCCATCPVGTPNCLWDPFGQDNAPGWIGRLTSLIASQYLRSPEWGAAQFVDTWYHSGLQVPSFETFVDLFDYYETGHLPYPYEWMRSVGFLPGPGYPGCLDHDPWLVPYERRAIEPLVGTNEYSYVAPDLLAVAPLWPYHYASWAVQDDIEPMLGQPPVADAGADQTVIAYGGQPAVATLDGSGSSDPDGSRLLYYEWSLDGAPGSVLGQGHGLAMMDVALDVGQYDIRLSLYDGYHVSESVTRVTVVTPCPVIHVDDDAPPGGDGRSWPAARNNLVEAIAVECGVAEIRVAGGTYKPGTARLDTFPLKNGVTIRGGYRGQAGGGEPDDRDIVLYQSVLSGDIGTVGDASDNAFHVVTGSGTDASAVLDGFTITGGHANGGSWEDLGAGVNNSSGGPTLRDCTLVDNSAVLGGGGMYNRTGSTPTLIGCTFLGNESGTYGGGIHNYDASHPTLINCLLRGNSSAQGGAIQSHTGCNPTLINCTLVDNTAQEAGGALHSFASTTDVANAVLWANTPQPIHDDGSATTVTFSCIQGGFAGDGNIGELSEHNPLFAGTGHRLLPGSPCIDAANNDAVPPSVTVDLARHWRFVDDPATADTGAGDPPIIDMGAYEYRPGDGDGDGDADLIDYDAFLNCVTGNLGGVPPQGNRI